MSACGNSEPQAGADSNKPPAASQGDDSSEEAVELTISAAASLTDAMNEIKTMYESKNKNIKLAFNLGASGALQQQIEQGAPVDLFLSAATKNMKALVDKQLIDASQQRNWLSNELVAVVPVDGKLSIASEQDLKQEELNKIAIGIPESVPAGNYAKEALTYAKLWDSLQSKMVQAKDVRQVLQYVETGNVDIGFVYKTDALTSSKVKVAFNVDPSSYSPVNYPMGIVKATKHMKEAEQFYDYLQTEEALNVFIQYGFSVPQ
ncbi:molybdate ABC transporter substrate-binding protein [Paenibacillus spongiae]|uniref:Molybdate ABC transporter substrate-binding protein n=1 Tax=Paenibacillus spongiae TaxID=2909671 RepID=A0ABY5SGI5_9BACL|nr:molybdate ABC transporter substrate-binding protein [Paenibacillus spongiae]UVI33092.1 molybdate ABC transporter substrate-binding protein [Paenibacillus spongiae]